MGPLAARCSRSEDSSPREWNESCSLRQELEYMPQHARFLTSTCAQCRFLVPTNHTAPRVANWIFRICLLDEATRRENTTFVINRGVIRRGCPTLSERKGGLFFACDAEKSETTVRNGRFALHFGARPPSGRHVRLLRTPAALVKRPRDWPWSSRPYYAKGENGPRRIDPAD